MKSDTFGIAGVLNLRFNKHVSDEKASLIIEMIYSQFQVDINGMNWFEFRDGGEGSRDFRRWINDMEVTI